MLDLPHVSQLRKVLGKIALGNPQKREDQFENFDFRSGLGDSAWLLHGICRSLKPNTAVEIGSARGKSACFIGSALKQNGSGHLYAIDPHMITEWNDSGSTDTFEIMSAHLTALSLHDFVTIIRKPSRDGLEDVPKPIDLLFIDGDHSYQGVKEDWESAIPFMSPFGIVVFHDTIWDLEPHGEWYRSDMGVPRFVEHLRREGYPVITVNRDCGVSLVQPKKGGIVLSELNT